MEMFHAHVRIPIEAYPINSPGIFGIIDQEALREAERRGIKIRINLSLIEMTAYGDDGAPCEPGSPRARELLFHATYPVIDDENEVE
jgi:hypothetical protein